MNHLFAESGIDLQVGGVMRDFWWQLAVSAGSPVAWVLDAGDDAVDAWPRAVELVSRVLSRLPADRETELYFLGNSAAYKSQQLPTMGAGWVQQNRSRCRLVSPVFEELQAKLTTTIVVLAAACPFDLADWLDSPMLDRVCFVSLSEAPIAEFSGRHCPAEADLLWERLQQRIAKIEVTQDSSIPITWDNAAYEWSGRSLVAGEATDYSITMDWLSHDDQPPTAVATWSNGSRHTLEPQPCESLNGAGWRTLGEQEAAAFRESLLGREFVCPVCGGIHADRRVKCKPRGSILGVPIYSRNELTKHRGFVVIRDCGASIEYRPHPCSVLQVAPERIAVMRAGQGIVQRFSARTRTWVDDGEFPQYRAVEGVGHAILL